ncbi:MAG: efflux transporter outer membrane subunit [bacterium]|nr:efflux transporter outer membrane subunit [bacterium]
MRLRLRAYLPLVLIPCAACAHNPPDPAELRLDVATGYGARITAGTPTGDYAGEDWWRAFDDQTLDALVAEALVANHDLEVAAARLRAADALVGVARADGRPSLDATAGTSRRRQNFIGFPIPGGDEEVLSSTTSVHDVGLAASWEVDLWGRIAAGTYARSAERDAAAWDLAGARLGIVARVARAWFIVRERRLQVELTERTLVSFEASERWIADRYEAGLSPPLDLRLARVEVENSRADLELLRDAYGRARRALEVLLGRYPEGAVESPGPLTAPPPPVPVGLPSELVARRPDLVAAELRARAADARIDEARAFLYPRFALTADAGRSSEALDDLLDGDFSVWGFVARLSAPIYSGGRRTAAIDGRAAERDGALAAFASVVLAAFGEVEDALASETIIARRAESLGRATAEAAAAESLADEQYRGGLVDVQTVLDARRRRFATEALWIAAQRRRLELRVDLHLALGGGFEAPAAVGEEEGQP